MPSVNLVKQCRLRRHAMNATAAAVVGFCSSVGAVEISTGNDDVQLRFDNTIRYNFGKRIEGQSSAIIGGANFDDGDRNFKKGSTVTNRLDLLTETDLVYKKKSGIRVSAASWYDQAYSGSFSNDSLATSNHLVNGAPAFGLSDYANRYYKGPSGEFLDAFVFTTVDLGEMPLTVRVGRHAVNWGEALLGGGAIHGNTYGQSPLDQAKGLSTPGIEAKELYLPLNQVSAQLQATPELSLAGQYFLGWNTTRVPDAGTYLGFADHMLNGGESLVLAPGVPGVRALRGPNLKPSDQGDWGLAARWSPQWFDGTMGFYVRNFSDKIPQTILIPATRQYFFNWGSDISLYGLSLAKQLGDISFGADLNYRKNMPLVSDTVAAPSAAALPGQGDMLGARGDTVHAVINALGVLPRTALADGGSYAAELTWNRWLKVTQGEQYFKGRPAYQAIDRVSKDYVGLAVNVAPAWYQVFPGADLSLPISYSVGLSGNSAVSSGGNKSAGSYSVGLGLDYKAQYRFDIKYVDYFGQVTKNSAGVITVPNGSTALLTDRGAVFFTFKTTF